MSFPVTPFSLLAKLSLLLAGCLLLGACTTMLSVTREEPIGENYGKRTPGAYVDDQFIETKSRVNLRKVDQRFAEADVSIHSYNGVVLLIGSVPDQTLRSTATQTIEKIRKVRRVHNELTIGQTRSWSAGFSDSWLRTKVKVKFMLDKNIESSRVKLVVNDGVSYLMGLVTRKEADAIVERARTTHGLQKIVRIFEYIEQPRS